MCARYYARRLQGEELMELFPELSIQEEDQRGETWDICPSMTVSALTGGDGRVASRKMTWGFLPAQGKGLLINARAESVCEKPTFRESAESRRCILPAAVFYEWNREKQKVTFSDPAGSLLFLAGIYRPFGEEDRFVILTTGANESMAPVHDRMPLMIERKNVRDWLLDDEAYRQLLLEKMPPLDSCVPFEQMSLF